MSSTAEIQAHHDAYEKGRRVHGILMFPNTGAHKDRGELLDKVNTAKAIREAILDMPFEQDGYDNESIDRDDVVRLLEPLGEM